MIVNYCDNFHHIILKGHFTLFVLGHVSGKSCPNIIFYFLIYYKYSGVLDSKI